MHHRDMLKRSSKSDFAQLAHSIVEQATGEPIMAAPKKNSAAVALGRLGGLKGGKARADSLTSQRRKAIAKKAAAARWKTD
jgi:hypothetical protein